jgi:hypothetical protein
MNNLKITPIKPLKNQNKEENFIMNPPFCAGIFSPPCTGKSTLISNICFKEQFFPPNGALEYFDGGVIVISPSIYLDESSRFLLKYCKCYDEYSDQILKNILDNQKNTPKEDRKKMLLIVDDCLNMCKRNSLLNSLPSRYRHYNLNIIFSCQKWTGIDSKVRAQFSHLFIMSPYPNIKEKNQIFEVYGDIYGGEKELNKLYEQATGGERYKFLYCILNSNPPKAFENFDKQIF